MSLSAGTRLGPYLVEAALGAGGMGEVYRARDTRLDRSVAIKVLASELTANPEFKRRFEREARAIATLDHPHICPIFDVGEHEGRGYLVMQHLEGETLATRLARGPLAIETALEHAEELARALATAHRAGVIHRDVKPGNIMVTRSGVKLLDFGVARVAPPDALSPASGSEDPATLSGSLTAPGALLGTLNYMAPEQLEGKRVDARSDIFACGAVVYEMVTGQRPFSADTQAALIAAVLTTDPPAMSTARSGVPAACDRVVKKCLAKDPDDRWQSANDLADEFKWIRDLQLDSEPTARATSRSLMRDARVWLVAIAAGVATAAGIALLLPSRGIDDPSTTTFDIELPRGADISRLDYALAFSPDDRYLAFTALLNGQSRLFVRPMDRAESIPLAGTEGAGSPFFGPDGQWVAFAGRRRLAKISLGGGTAMSLVEAIEGTTGAAWGARDDIVFAPGSRSGLLTVPAAGGNPRQLTTVNSPRESHRYPDFLPGGRAVIYMAGPPAGSAWYDADLVVKSLDGGEPRVLIRGAAQARYAPGHIVYSRAGTLFAVPFDLATLQVTGAAVPVLEGVREAPGAGISQFAISPKGSLAYVPGSLITNEVQWVDRRGQPQPLMRTPQPEQLYQPRLSPNGEHLAIIVARGDDDVWTYDLKRDVFSRFSSGANHGMPEWTPDGARITFTQSGNPPRVLSQPADRSTPASPLNGEINGVPNSWSPDGRLLAYTKEGEGTASDIWTFDIERRHHQTILATAFDEQTPTISPDGRWLAYISDESGRYEVYVQSFPTSSRRWRVSHDGGTEPRWARSGKELFFRRGNTLMAAATATGPPFGKPESLFTLTSWQGHSSRTNYDVASDGRFVIVRLNEPEDAGTRIRVVLNWAQQLKRLAPR